MRLGVSCFTKRFFYEKNLPIISKDEEQVGVKAAAFKGTKENMPKRKLTLA